MQADATWVSATPRRMSWSITHLIRCSCRTLLLGTSISSTKTRRTWDTRKQTELQTYTAPSRGRACRIFKISRNTLFPIQLRNPAKSPKFKIKLGKDSILTNKNLGWRAKEHKEWCKTWWATLRTSTSRRSRSHIKTMATQVTPARATAARAQRLRHGLINMIIEMDSWIFITMLRTRDTRGWRMEVAQCLCLGITQGITPG